MTDEVKKALRISTTAFDDEIELLIESAKQDLGLADVSSDVMSSSIVKLAIITYCKMNFGEPDQYDRLKKSYDEQKMQLQTARDYRG